MGQPSRASPDRFARGSRLDESLGGALAARLFFLVIHGDLLQVFSFEDLIAVHASQVVDSVAAHQEFSPIMFTARHRKQNIPILMNALSLSSPYPVLVITRDVVLR